MCTQACKVSSDLSTSGGYWKKRKAIYTLLYPKTTWGNLFCYRVTYTLFNLGSKETLFKYPFFWLSYHKASHTSLHHSKQNENVKTWHLHSRLGTQKFSSPITLHHFLPFPLNHQRFGPLASTLTTYSLSVPDGLDCLSFPAWARGVHLNSVLLDLHLLQPGSCTSSRPCVSPTAYCSEHPASNPVCWTHQWFCTSAKPSLLPGRPLVHSLLSHYCGFLDHCCPTEMNEMPKKLKIF